MTYHNDDDDDTLIYDSGPSKSSLWLEITKLRDRVRELECEIAELKKL